MEFAITVTIVLAAGLFVASRWIRSVKRALTPTQSGTCAGNCEGCTVVLELRQEVSSTHDSNSPAACRESQPAGSTSKGARKE